MLLFFPLFLCAAWKPLPFKPLKSKEVTLTVAHITNPRFPVMDEKQIEIYLDETQRIVKEHFGIRITFERTRSMSVTELFETIPLKIQKEANESVYDFKHDKGDKKRLAENLYEALKVYEDDLPAEEMFAYALPHLTLLPKENTLQALAQSLIDTEIDRLKRWLKIKAKDGNSVIDANPYNEWSYWDALGHTQRSFDIILTNQLIASAEYYGQDIHSALRGGIVAGTTSYKKNSPYDAFIFATSFLFINNDPLITELRGGKTYTPEEAARYAGAYLAHEIGHMLFRFAHPFGKPGCVMSPAKLLLFHEWYGSVDAKLCPIGCCKSMQPGSAVLYFNDAW